MSKEVQAACEILGLETLSDRASLRTGYKQMVKQWHPDRFHNNEEMEQVAVAKTQRINLAYRLLLETLEKADPAIRNGNGSRKHSSENSRHQYDWQTYSDGFPNQDVSEFFLNSSHIVSAGYDKYKKILYLKFLGDEIYLYYDVPGFIFDHLLKASSAGKYALKFIYNRFRYRKFAPLIRR